MGKQVKVVTKCGEEHVYNYDQEVVSAEIVEKKEYAMQDRLDTALEALEEGCKGNMCANCGFKFADEHDCTKMKARYILQKAVAYKEE